jgi:FMN phosphatase YigB (HAD superfamily)
VLQIPTFAIMGRVVVAFDLYGTLLSTASIAKELASHFGQEKADSIAAVWRKYQLEYTWRLNSMSTEFSARSVAEDPELIVQKDNMKTSPT